MRQRIKRRVNNRRARGYNRNNNVNLWMFITLVLTLTFIGFSIVQFYKNNKPIYDNPNVNTYDTYDEYIDSELIKEDLNTKYNLQKLTCSEEIFKIVDSIAESHNLPTYIWYSIVGMESQFNPKTRSITDTEDSRGLFQINTKVHHEVDKVQVYCPTYNSEYQIPKLATIYEEGLALGLESLDLVYYVVEHGQRPKLEDENVKNYVKSAITQYYHELMMAELN